ncbi:hypothetical protein AAC387_Pa03g1935 [Persea americana]
MAVFLSPMYRLATFSPFLQPPCSPPNCRRQYYVRAAGSDDEGKVVIRKEKSDWNIDYSAEKPTTPLLDTINYPLHMKNLSSEVSVFMVLILFSSFLCLLSV